MEILNLEGSEDTFSLAKLDDDKLASVESDGIKIWDLKTKQLVTRLVEVSALSLAKLDDDRFASGGEDGTIKIWKEELDIAD